MTNKPNKTVILIVSALALFLLIIVVLRAPSVVGFVSSNAKHVDALVALAPVDERLPEALELFASDRSEVLVVSSLESALLDQSSVVAFETGNLCERSGKEEKVFCFSPQPETTIGEALGVRQLATENGWETIGIVTNDYHALRTQFIFETCLPEVEIEVFSFSQNMNMFKWAYRLTYEAFAVIKAQVETKIRC